MCKNLCVGDKTLLPDSSEFIDTQNSRNFLSGLWRIIAMTYMRKVRCYFSHLIKCQASILHPVPNYDSFEKQPASHTLAYEAHKSHFLLCKCHLSYVTTKIEHMPKPCTRCSN